MIAFVLTLSIIMLIRVFGNIAQLSTNDFIVDSARSKYFKIVINLSLAIWGFVLIF